MTLDAAFRDHWGRVLATLTGVLGDIELAEDAAAEAFAIAAARWPREGEPTNPIGWLVTTARNRAIDQIRKKTEVSIEENSAVLEVAADSPDPLARREMTEELRRLLACMGRLDEERRRLVLFAYYDGWSREQLAAKFEKPVNTVKTWLRRALMEIRECLGS